MVVGGERYGLTSTFSMKQLQRLSGYGRSYLPSKISSPRHGAAQNHNLNEIEGGSDSLSGIFNIVKPSAFLVAQKNISLSPQIYPWERGSCISLSLLAPSWGDEGWLNEKQ
ncbi:hypothetical protein KM043_016452 [Ampulex compressa]|nr:hypothetical protein KM043_016452 [Ampulex compressa]